MQIRPYLRLIALVLLTAPACDDDPTREPAEGASCEVGSPMVRTDLFFGRSRQGAPPVSESEWQGFVDAVVTPLFEEGLTMFDTDGQYLSSSGELIKEDSKVLILLHEGTPAASDDIDTLRESYKAQFDQESVLRVDTPVCVSF